MYLCICHLEIDEAWKLKAVSDALTQMYSENMFQDNLRLSVYVIIDTAIPESLLF